MFPTDGEHICNFFGSVELSCPCIHGIACRFSEPQFCAQKTSVCKTWFTAAKDGIWIGVRWTAATLIMILAQACNFHTGSRNGFLYLSNIITGELREAGGRSGICGSLTSTARGKHQRKRGCRGCCT